MDFWAFWPDNPGSLIPAGAETKPIREESSYAEPTGTAAATRTAACDGGEQRDGQEDRGDAGLPVDVDHRHHLSLRREGRSRRQVPCGSRDRHLPAAADPDRPGRPPAEPGELHR